MSRATVLISTLFGLGKPGRRKPSAASARAVLSRILTQDSCIALVQGPSGCGKSSLLAAIGRIARRRQIPVVRAVRTPLGSNTSVIDHVTEGCDPFLRSAAGLLCACGLGEPAMWIRPARTLSDSERARLDLAVALARAEQHVRRGPKVIVMDEFLSTLDRATAKLTAIAVRKLVSSMKDVRLILATAHDDLLGELEPSFVVRNAGGES